MKREEKQQVIDRLHTKFASARVAILSDFSGMDVAEITELRQKLRAVRAELQVVKNTLAIRAADGTSLAGARDRFAGPIALTLGYDDPVAPARVVKEFADKVDRLKVRVGVVEGRVLDLQSLKAVAALPGREALLAQLVGQLQAPTAGLVWCLEGLLQQLVGVLEAVKQQKQS